MTITLTEVSGEEEFKLWYKFFREVFPRDEDNFPYELMKSWLPYNFFLFIEVDSQKVGFIFERVNEKTKAQ